MKINFDFEELLGDIVSTEGLYIDFLDCNEYTIWYLIRQAGIKSFLAVLNTKAFYRNESNRNEVDFGIYKDFNLNQIKDNLYKYYNIKIINFDEHKCKLKDFIKEGISKNQFIFTLYDYYYDTLADGEKIHEIHGHTITGIDNERGIYLSLLPDKYEVKFNDLEIMLREYTKKSSKAKNYCFYLDISKFGYSNNKNLLQFIQTDILNTINDWKEEIEYFNQYISVLNKLEFTTKENKKAFALKGRLLFNSILAGMHGNFIFKLRLISEYFSINTCTMENDFCNNRKQSAIISNLYRKAVVILDDDEAYFNELLHRVSHNIHRFFVDESNGILLKFIEVMGKEGVVNAIES